MNDGSMSTKNSLSDRLSDNRSKEHGKVYSLVSLTKEKLHRADARWSFSFYRLFPTFRRETMCLFEYFFGRRVFSPFPTD